MKAIVLLSVFLSVAFANDVLLRNNCPFTVWPAILGNPGKGQPEDGGFALEQSATKNVNFADDWQGRLWGRTNCNAAGHCETGDCGDKIECNGASGLKPATLAEFGFHQDSGNDYYDISHVDGYNLPMRMTPTAGYSKTTNDHYDCNSAGCNADLNANCPSELAVKNSAGSTVACNSGCTKFDNDEYCCRGAHNTPETCKSSDWPVNYPAFFKSACPDAYGYAYDDVKSTFTCKGNPNTSYEIVFCP